MDEPQQTIQPRAEPLTKQWWFWVLVSTALLAAAVFTLNKFGSTVVSEIDFAPEVSERAGQTTSQKIYAPEFALSDVAGKKVRLSEFKGQIAILSFWTSWNPESLEQLKILNDYQSRQGQPAAILAVNSQEDKEAVQNIWRRSGYTIPILLDQDGTVGEAYQIGALPLTVFVDQNGYIRAKIVGLTSVEEIETQLKLMQ